MDDGFVDQGAMMDDYFESSELVYQDSGEEFSPTTTDESEKVETEPIEAEQSEESDVETTGEPENKEESTDDPFSFVTTDENGEERFDPISAMEFITRKKEGSKEPVPEFRYELPPIEPNQQAAAEPENNYEESIQQVYLAGFDYLEAFLNQGYDYHDALQLAKQSAQNDLKDHLSERKLSEMEKRLQSTWEQKMTKQETMSEVERLRPVSIKNLHEMAREGGYQNIEQFQTALMTPGLGGDAINWLFASQNAGKNYKSVEERAEDMNNWFIKFSADKQGLQFLEEITNARIAKKQLPRIIAEARKTRDKVMQSNGKAKGTIPASALNKNRPNPANRQSDPMSEYLGIDQV